MRKIAVNMPSDVAHQIARLARENGVSFSAQAARLLQERLLELNRIRPDPDRMAVVSVMR